MNAGLIIIIEELIKIIMETKILKEVSACGSQALEGILTFPTYVEINDTHYWKVEYSDDNNNQTLTCKF